MVAGDIFDNEYAAVYQPEEIAKTLRNIKSTYGVYACYGNHDVEEKYWQDLLLMMINIKKAVKKWMIS